MILTDMIPMAGPKKNQIYCQDIQHLKYKTYNVNQKKICDGLCDIRFITIKDTYYLCYFDDNQIQKKNFYF